MHAYFFILQLRFLEIGLKIYCLCNNSAVVTACLWLSRAAADFCALLMYNAESSALLFFTDNIVNTLYCCTIVILCVDLSTAIADSSTLC